MLRLILCAAILFADYSAAWAQHAISPRTDPIEIEESAYVLDPRFQLGLNNLITALEDRGQVEEAEALMGPASAGADPAGAIRLAQRLRHHAYVLTALTKTREAEALLRRAIGLYGRSSPTDSANLALAQFELANLRRAAGDHTEAELLSLQALENLRGVADGEELAMTTVRELGRIQLEAGQARRAEETLRSAVSRTTAMLGPESFESGVAHFWLAGALASQRRVEEAWVHAVAAMGGLREAASSGILAFSFAPAVERVLDVAQRRAPRTGAEFEAVFEAMQFLSRTDVGVDGVRAAARLAEVDPELADLLERVRTLRKGVSDLARQRAQALGRGDAAAVHEARAAFVAERARWIAAEKELSARRPQFRELAGRHLFRIADFNGEDGVLRDREALLIAAQTRARLNLMLITTDRVRFRSIALSRTRAAALVARLRAGVRIDEVLSPAELPEFDLAAAHDLYRRIVGPFKGELRRVETMYVVSHGPLASIPLALLVAEPSPPRANPFERYRRTRFLGDEVALATLPSPGVLVISRRRVRPSRAEERFLAFADPALAGTENIRTLAHLSRVQDAVGGATLSERNAAAVCRMRPLPGTRREALAVAHGLGSDASDVLLGRAASERALHELSESGALAQRRIVLFATHGFVSSEESSAAEPALALTPPESCVATTESEDGLLTASEIATLTLDADWVILSGCNTAAPDGRPRAAPLSGLGRAFLYAGARRLLVSHWSVDSEAAADLTTALFDPRNANLTPAAALQRAMRAMRESRGPQTYRAHPAFWAPFVLVGDGG